MSEEIQKRKKAIQKDLTKEEIKDLKETIDNVKSPDQEDFEMDDVELPQGLEEKLDEIEDDTSLGIKEETVKPDKNTKCKICKLNADQLKKKYKKAIDFIHDLDDDSQFWCAVCLNAEKHKILNERPTVSVSIEKKLQKPQVLLKRNKEKDEEAELAPISDLMDDLSNTFAEMEKSENAENDSFFDDIGRSMDERDVKTLKEGILDYPATIDFLFSAMNAVEKSIEIKHEFLDKMDIDLKRDKSVYRDDDMQIMIEMYPFTFYIKKPRVVKKFLKAMLYRLEILKHKIIKASKWTHDVDFSFHAAFGMIRDLHTRCNTLEGRVTMLQNDPIELQKLFGGIEIHLIVLAPIENQLNEGSEDKLGKLWKDTTGKDKDEFLVDHVTPEIVKRMSSDDKIVIFNSLTKEVTTEPKDLINLFNNLELKDRENYLIQLKTQMTIAEFKKLVPEAFMGGSTIPRDDTKK